MQPRRRFRFLKELSEGAFGKVYLAEMVTGEGFSSVVAIKLLHGKWTGHTEIVQRSRDEARVLGLLHHRNIIRVEDLTSINGQCAIVMEYLDGVDLKSLINFCNDNEIQIPRKVAFEVMAQTASALHAAYSSQPLQGGDPLAVIHRDIKPSNVMLTTAGDVKVLDFGTAQAQFDEREAHTQALAFGSAAYMAPERLLGDPDTPFGDIFSVGITLYELLTRKGFGKINIRPEKFERRLTENLESMDLSDLGDERAAQVIAMMRLVLAYEPEDRPTAGQVVELLEALAEEIHDGSVRRFCREVVGPCRATMEPQQNPDDPLTGSTLFEDTGTMMRAIAEDRGPDETWIEDELSEEVSNPNGGAQGGLQVPRSSFAASIQGPGNSEVPSEEGLGAAVRVSNIPDDDDESEEVEEASGEDAGEAEEPSTEAAAAAEEADEEEGAAESSPAAEGAFAEEPSTVQEPVSVASTGAAGSGPRNKEPVARVAEPSVGRQASFADPVDEEEEGGGGVLKLLVAALVLVVIGGGVLAAVIAGGLLSTAGGAGGEDPVAEGPTQPETQPDAIPTAPADALSGGSHELGAGSSTVVLSLSDPGKGIVSLKGPSSKLEWDGTGELELTAADAGLWRGKVATATGSARATFEVPEGQRCSFQYDIQSMPDEWEALGCE